tara:strand:- start:28852 stop:29070 length:219 start_codon:yes stop_codon:yes gene_type:complete
LDNTGEVIMNLSDQALGAIMMALQKSLLEQSDIVPVLKNFNFMLNEEQQLNVTNPPTFKIDNQETLVTVGSD